LGQVPFRRTEWIEYGFIPEHEFTLIEGRGDIGKTTCMVTFLAKWTIGERWVPVNETIARFYPFTRPLSAMMIAHEDRPGDLRARFQQAGGDTNRVHHITGLDRLDADGNIVAHDPIVRLPQDLDALEALHKEHPFDVLFLDAVHMTIRMRDAKDSYGARDAYTIVSEWCRRIGVTIVGIRHYAKGSGREHDRALGNSEIGHVVRSTLAFGFHPEDRDNADLLQDSKRRIFAQDKKNLSESVPAIVYKIERIETTDDVGKYVTVPVIKYLGTDENVKARDIAMDAPAIGEQPPQTKEAACIYAILGLFLGTDTLTADEIVEGTRQFSKGTRDRARSELTRTGVLVSGKEGEVGE
jgi:hypothetical protein